MRRDAGIRMTKFEIKGFYCISFYDYSLFVYVNYKFQQCRNAKSRFLNLKMKNHSTENLCTRVLNGSVLNL